MQYPFFTPERGAKLINGKPVLIVSFSGGETSGFMAQRLKKELGHLYHIIFIFANTGCENNETLDFVDACDRAFDLGVVWVEAVIHPRDGDGVTHRVTTYEKAYRHHQFADPLHPFHAHIRKSGIPNANKPQCSDRLKAFAIEDYKRTHGLQGQPHCIGIRGDESSRIMSKGMISMVKSCGANPDQWRKLETHDERVAILSQAILLSEKQRNQVIRYSKKLRQYGLCYPLTDLWPSAKSDVHDFWESQPFRLPLEEHEGNCQTCWKKTDRKLYLLAKEHPERFEAFKFFEQHYQHVKPNTDADAKPRLFFRKHRSASDIIEAAKPYSAVQLRRLLGTRAPDEDGGDGCSESCESYSLF